MLIATRAILIVIISNLTVTSTAYAQLCGPPWIPPFEGTSIFLVLANLTVVLAGYILVSGLFRKRRNRVVAGIGVFALGIFIASYISMPYLVHVERLTGQIIELNKLDTTPDKFRAFCYRGIDCPIIPLSDVDLANNPPLQRAISEGNRYPNHLLVNWYEKESLVNTILSIAEKQPIYNGNVSSAIFKYPNNYYDSYVLNYDGNYYRIFITYEMANHYGGTVPFTYHTTEILLWNSAIMLFFLLLNWKLSLKPPVADSGGTGLEESSVPFGRFNKKTFVLVKRRILCDFLARRNIKKTLPVIVPLAFFAIVPNPPDIRALFIDAIVILTVYVFSVAAARRTCNKVSQF